LNVALASEPIRIEADPARLEQVFVNLLSNAAKYTEAGGQIDVVVKRQGEQVAVRIRDTGIGIAPEMLPRVWNLFTQADRALDRAQGGLGIGLTIARRLVELHGARIEAHSQGLGKGAEFVVTLPAFARIEEARPAAPAEPVSQRTARVLLVEDNPDAAESLTMLLELLGHRVRATHDGVAALDAARANVPDVMLVDIGLPGMDGYEVARRVRRDPDLKHVVLVALTGYGQEEDKRQAMAAGFDYHLVKPVNPDALHGLVARLGKQETEKPPQVH
jgi:two-component system CheB/CheR fusion protein